MLRSPKKTPLPGLPFSINDTEDKGSKRLFMSYTSPKMASEEKTMLLTCPQNLRMSSPTPYQHRLRN